MSDREPDRQLTPSSRFVSIALAHEAAPPPAARVPRIAGTTIDVSGKRRKPATLANWIGWIGVPLYCAVLLVVASLPGPAFTLTMPELSVNALRSFDGAMPWITFAAGMIALGVGRFAPLGFLMVLALPRRRRFTRRLLFVGLPSVIAASFLATCLLYATSGAGTDSGAVIFASASCAVGAWAGIAWLRGWLARFLLLPKLAAAALAIAMAAGANLYFSLQAQPFESGSAAVTSDTTRRVYRMFRGKNPKSLQPGETATLRLSGDGDQRDPRLGRGLDAGRGEPRAGGTGRRQPASPGVGALADPPRRREIHQRDCRRRRPVRQRPPRTRPPPAAARIDGGAAVHAGRALAAGHRPGQRQPATASAARGGRGPEGDRSRRDGDCTATPIFRRARWRRCSRGRRSRRFAPASRRRSRTCWSRRRGAAAGDARFGASLESAFRYARERSKNGDPKLENQAAILALGMLLGDSKVERLVGPVIDVSRRREAGTFEGATLRQREDWTKHFLLSASISVLSTQGIGDGVGLFKEELDSDGGSGFSFGDLLADKAGVAFAMAATQTDASARAIQDRLAGGYRVDDFMPAGADLPENMQQAEFRMRFGGVGGADIAAWPATSSGASPRAAPIARRAAQRRDRKREPANAASRNGALRIADSATVSGHRLQPQIAVPEHHRQHLARDDHRRPSPGRRSREISDRQRAESHERNADRPVLGLSQASRRPVSA